MGFRSLLSACVLPLFILPAAAQAATETDSFKVLIKIEDACVVTAGTSSNINLGDHPTTGTDITGS